MACPCPASLPPWGPARLLGQEAADCGSQGRWWQGSLAAGGFCINRGRQKSRGRDVGPVVSPACVPISEEGEGEESGGLCLKIHQSLGLRVTHSTLFSARLSR